MGGARLSTVLTLSVPDGCLTVVTNAERARGARPRPSLDRALIVETALRVAERPDVDTLTFRRLGTELGADHTAVYRHFADRDELMQAIIDRLLADITAGIDPAAPWDERLRESGMATLAAARRYPSVGIELALHTTGGQGERASIELELVAWRESGLHDADTVRFYAIFSSYVLSAAAAVAGHVVQAERHEVTDQSWVGALDDIDPGATPVMAELRAPLVALEVDRTYSDGVDLIIDAARSAVRSYQRTRGAAP